MATLIDPLGALTEEGLGALSGTQVKLPDSPTSRTSTIRADLFAQTILLALLFAVPALMCVHFACVNDPDLWWHMRTGEWVLQHHAIPRVDSFSVFAGKPWLDYSWLFELTVVKLFQQLGLVGIVGYSTAMILAITVALYHMVRRLQGDLSLNILLTFAATFSIGHMYTPRPWLFTILFFVLELDILMNARRTGRLRELVWLPVIFAIWANVHIEFVDGLFVLGIALAETVLARWSTGSHTRIRPAWMGCALVASVLATLLNPFGWRVYAVAYGLMTQGGALNRIMELQAIPFRTPPDFVVLLLALGSTAALAWQRRFLLFETVLLVFAVILSFRSQRDVWVMAAVAAAVLASSIPGRARTEVKSPRIVATLAVIMAGLAVLVGFRAMHVNNSRLEIQVAETLPVRAVQAIREKGYADSSNRPVFNDFNWGGYLVWALRMPVSIDGRQNVYGDQRMDRSIATWNGEPDWASDHELMSSGLVIGPVKASLIQILRKDSRFQLVYEDKIAAVFISGK